MQNYSSSCVEHSFGVCFDKETALYDKDLESGESERYNDS